jgi:hypothetical protein
VAIELDPILAAAQDAQSRKPLISLVSGSYAADFPLTGEVLTGDSQETAPAAITHSSGRLVHASAYTSGGINYIRFGYTDAGRTAFTFVDIDEPASLPVQDVALCELANGNIGILYRAGSGATQYIKYLIRTVTGVAVSAGIVATFGSTPWLSGPHVIRLASGGYLAVFARLDGADFKLYKLTSSDFVSWTGPTEIPVGGLTSTLRKFDPFLIQITTGDIWLLFAYTEAIDGSGAELSNIYYSVSSDNGVTWSTATKVTNYTLFSQVGTHPAAVQKAVGTIRLLCNEVMTALNIDENTTGLDGATVEPSDMTFDPVTRKLYVVSSRMAVGAKSLHCVFKVDVDTWTVERKWDLSSVPAFPSIFDTSHDVWYSRHHGERYLIPIGIVSQMGSTCVSLLNANTDEGTITNYIFDSIPAYGLTKNVTHSLMANYYLEHTWVDFDNERLYCVFSEDGLGLRIIIGYIDTDEIGPNYNFHTIVDDADAMEPGTMSDDLGFLILPSEDLVIVSNHCDISDWSGFVQMYQLSSGAEYKRYTMAEQAGFPLHGIGKGRLAWIAGHIYGTFTYENLYGEGDKRGLCDIDTTLDTVICHRPSWATLDEYALNCCKATADGRLIISTSGYGMTIFDPTAQTWELYNSDNVPGISGEGYADAFLAVEFDDSGGFVFAGRLWYGWPGGDAGLTMFSEYGYMRQAQYIEGLFGTEWTFGVPTPLVSGYTDFDAVGALDPSDSSMYAFWTNETGTEEEGRWGKEGATLDLGSYLLRGSDIVFKRSKGSPSRLECSVSHGHLFDPHNTNSLLSIYLKKGRKITLKFGDRVGEIDYWQDQGAFLVTDTKMLPVERGQYPIMQIIAQDRRCTWDHTQIRATDYYETYPENILSDVVVEHLGFVVGDVDLPVFDNRETIYIQWVDAMAKDIVDQICDRFGYYPRMTVDDKFSARRISASNSVDHIYADNTRIVDFTPDDSFSDFTNRVIVTGFERTEVEVLYGEERIETISGTVGWWGFKKDFNIYYSTDGSRRCRDPRLVVLESSTSIAFYLAGRISEEISHVDANELYCVIHVEAPNLIPVLLAALAVAVIGYGIGDGWFGVGGGMTVPIGRRVEQTGVILALMVLGSTGNFQYEVWARPLGKIRRSIQSDPADDLDLQRLVNSTIPRISENSLCTNVAACNLVANQELLEIMLQRSRVTFTKTAHLQDEDGDTLQIPHWYTGRPMKVFVTDLTRKYKIPLLEDEDGYFLDEIEGWRLPA